MPVIGIPVNLLLQRIKTKMGREALVTHLQYLGCDVEGYATLRRFRCTRCDNLAEITETENPPVLCDRCGTDFKVQPEAQMELGSTDVIRMELLAVRPDMFDPGGLARVLRNYLEESLTPAHYELAPPATTVTVDPLLAGETSYRPIIACAIVREFALTDDLTKVIMKLQENLHWAMGRDRKLASIGVYDLDTVQGPNFSYRTVGPEELRFVPLGYDPKNDQHHLTPREVLEQHPKGKAYARLLTPFKRYPLLCDGNGQVLSMPPIINSEPTRVSRNTHNFFIDVTGTDDRLVNKCLNVLVTSLAELDPAAKLEQVKMLYKDRQVITPNLDPQIVQLDPQMAARIIGVELDREATEHHLRRMGHDIKSREATALEVYVPAYRNDIMHPIDLAEDVAIAYGYHNIQPILVPTMTVGKERDIEHHAEVSRRAMTGLGYQEAITLLLSSLDANYDSLLLPRADNCVLIENPISVDQTIIRTSLMPGLLDTFGVNLSHELPQRIFEIGNITLLDEAAETGAREIRKIAAATIGPHVDYSEIRSAAEALLREFGWHLAAEPLSLPCFIPGRGAQVLAIRDNQTQKVGIMGELHPQVLENYKLVHPVSIFEIDLELLAKL